MEPCELCGHVFAQKHRIVPGRWGGTYDQANVVYLCPNHHAAIHLLMKWFYLNGQVSTEAERIRLKSYLTPSEDRSLHVFWTDTVKPIVVARMESEGKSTKLIWRSPGRVTKGTTQTRDSRGWSIGNKILKPLKN